MAYKINGDCMNCGACKPDCRDDAIKEGDAIFVIDVEKCTECVGWFNSQKCAEVCPVGAPVADADHQESREQLLEKWKKLHPGKIPTLP